MTRSKTTSFVAPAGRGSGPMMGRAAILTEVKAPRTRKKAVGFAIKGKAFKILDATGGKAVYRKVMFRTKRSAPAAELVQVPRAMLEELQERIEELEDARDLGAAAKNAKPGDYLPAAMMDRIIAGEHPVRVWREHRGLSARALAEKAGVTASYLSEIETRKKPGSIDAYRDLAEALDLSIDDVAP